MQARLRPGRKSASESDALPSSLATRNQDHLILLGIDPSLRGTGYGVIQMAGRTPSALAHGTITCPQSYERSRCLARIHETIRDVIQTHQPTVCVVEGLFFAQNHQTTLIMGEARGAALAAVALCGLEIYEIAPRKMKLAIVGYGAAQKSAVARMVQRMLNLTEIPQGDAADALGLALTFTREHGSFSLAKPNKI